MKYIQFSLLFLCLWLMNSQAIGQSFTARPFTNQDSLLSDIKKVMKVGASSKSDSIMAVFETVYNSALDTLQKRKVYEVSRNLLNGGYRTNPHFENFYAVIGFGFSNKKLDLRKIDQFLSVMDTCSGQYQKYITARFLNITRNFVETETVHTSKFNSLKAEKSEFSFGHVYDESITLHPKAIEALKTPVVDASKDEWFEHLEKKDTVVVKEKVKKEEEKDDGGWDTGDDNGWDSGDDDGWDTDSDDGWDTGGDDTSDDTGGDNDGWGSGIVKEVMKKPVEKKKKEKPAFVEPVFLVENTPIDVMPQIIGPFIQFENVDLSFSSVFDTFQIQATNGKLMAKDKVFVGNKGRVTWEGVGLAVDEVYGSLNDYSFNAKSPIVSANDVDMTYMSKFDSVVKGQFTYQARPKVRGYGKVYPQFISYHADVPVKDVMEDVIFRGGFSLKGSHIFSESITGGASAMEVSKEGELKFRAKSNKPFIFADSLVLNAQTSLVIYEGNDSITHPAVQLKYDANNSRLTARKDRHAYKHAQFESSYHKLGLAGDYLTWNLATDSVKLGIINAKDKIPLVAQSADFFNQNQYARLKGLASFHPVQMVVGYRNLVKSPKFYSADMANKYKKNPATIKGAMGDISRQGYIDYNYATDVVTVKRKAVLASYASMRRADYDNIRIGSLSPSGNNATFLLDSLNLNLTGVKSFLISDSLRVLVTPDNGEIKVKKNRNIAFAGEIKAGKFLYRGEDFGFHYDSFLVNMPYISELAFIVPDSATGEPGELSNSMVGTSGVLYISEPKNKSGLKAHDEYPKFQASSGGSFFFGGDEILGGAYKGDSSIYFDVPPFAIDSLNNSDPNSLNFAGTFYSGGIFPTFEENVRVMPDKSFGFERLTPEEGYPIYENKLKEKATYYSKIRLDNKGIRGDGRIEYLTGEFISDDFVFFSDSVTTTRGSGGQIKPGNYASASYPSVKFERYNMDWLVNKDSMLLTSQSGKPFEIYNKGYSFNGTLALSPVNLFGGGVFESANSTTKSQNFAFEETRFVSTRSLFLIKSDNPAKPSMRGVRVTVDYNIADKYADISSEKAGDDVFTFPYAQYSTSLGKAHWDFVEEKVYLTATDTAKGYVSTFTSLNPSQDELEFSAKSAVYDQKEQTLNMEGVEGIRVANVIIVPDQGKVVVRENAEMDVLANSSVVINSFTKYHTLTKGNLKIRSRKRFDGDAVYTYVNNVNDSMEITFDHFNVKTITGDGKDKNSPKEKFEVSADAIVSESDDIKIFAGLLYKGKVSLVDYKKFLEFEGVITLDIDRNTNSWFSYKSDTEENHGKIWIDENTKQAGFPTRLATGLYIGNETKQLYGTMLEYRKERARDLPVFQAKGFLTFNNETKDYVISPAEKLTRQNPKGNKFVYNHDSQEINYDGVFNLIKADKDFLVEASGKGNGNIEKGTYDLNVMLKIGFEPNQDALDVMLTDFEEKTHETPANPIFSELKNKVAQFLEPKAYEKYVQEAQSSGEQGLSGVFSSSINLSDVDFTWSEEHQAFYSTGEIGLANIFKGEVNSKVKGYIEIPKIENSSVIKIYLETHDGKWYYFAHSKNDIFVYSSNEDFNIAVSNKKSKDKLKLTEPHEISLFLEDFNVKYLGGEGSFKGGEKTDDDPFKKKEEKKDEEEKKDGF